MEKEQNIILMEKLNIKVIGLMINLLVVEIYFLLYIIISYNNKLK